MDSMSDAEFDAKVGFPVGERYVPKSKLDAAEARATAAERERDALREALADIANTINIVGSPYDALHKAIDELVLGVKKRARAALTANHSAPVVEE